LFNLTDEVSYKVIDGSKATLCSHESGPCFGEQELYVMQPFLADNKGMSFANKAAY
jgi:hypothetical protein